MYYDGVYYGDWCVHDEPIEGIEIDKLEVEKTKLKDYA